jgi:hypothetical protein
MEHVLRPEAVGIQESYLNRRELPSDDPRLANKYHFGSPEMMAPGKSAGLSPHRDASIVAQQLNIPGRACRPIDGQARVDLVQPGSNGYCGIEAQRHA